MNAQEELCKLRKTKAAAEGILCLMWSPYMDARCQRRCREQRAYIQDLEKKIDAVEIALRWQHTFEEAPMTIEQAKALGYEVIKASSHEVGLLKNGKGIRTWFCQDFDRRLPELSHPLIVEAILRVEKSGLT